MACWRSECSKFPAVELLKHSCENEWCEQSLQHIECVIQSIFWLWKSDNVLISFQTCPRFQGPRSILDKAPQLRICGLYRICFCICFSSSPGSVVYSLGNRVWDIRRVPTTHKQEGDRLGSHLSLSPGSKIDYNPFSIEVSSWVWVSSDLNHAWSKDEEVYCLTNPKMIFENSSLRDDQLSLEQFQEFHGV